MKKISLRDIIMGFVLVGIQHSAYIIGYWLSLATGAVRRAVFLGFPLEDSIPFFPPAVIVYVGSFIFWPLTFALTRANDFSRWTRIRRAQICIAVTGGLMFWLYPTGMDRTVLYAQLENGGFGTHLLRWIYNSDGGLTAYQLFPSFHCSASALCCLCVYKNRDYPKALKAFIFVYALMICISTLLTKQHYAVDIAGGWLVAVLSYYLVGRFFKEST